ncbi:ergothioneine biosynthesis protein EgtB [Luteithermobacter gelatinilyticus]|uniref:ergothioneine biosynthesis protein EgtB n=1 Tax=Luteithermobacter gelatinilyticus TaxID=2582913 RepID=UPI0011070343|nr:ergothioneine biosynthesis protein EgtB [Luteithermobacter gelatinilyticus]
MTTLDPISALIASALLEQYRAVRAYTESLCVPLEIEDYVIQPSPEVSPPKWHLAHTTWFFENFILNAFDPDYTLFHPTFPRLFNSYYKSQGDHWLQGERGQLSRPTVAEIYRYRHSVDRKLAAFLAPSRHPPETAKRLAEILEIGLHHEQQHQELLIMDIKYIFGHDSLKPVYADRSLDDPPPLPAARFISVAGGLVEIGHDPAAGGFAYCNETPRHRVFLEDFQLQNRPVSNGEYLAFMEDGGYENPLLWKSDGWDHLHQGGDKKPLYWVRQDGAWYEFTLYGLSPLRLNAPLSHINFYEADAYACWAGARLPTEFEWERAATLHPSDDTIQPQQDIHYETRYQDSGSDFFNLHGTCWQWTSSAYLPYPRYRRPEGALGEYNGKFMINQKVLRGGCYATPPGHYRPTYRNFFYPHQKWAITGLRLAKDMT